MIRERNILLTIEYDGSGFSAGRSSLLSERYRENWNEYFPQYADRK